MAFGPVPFFGPDQLIASGIEEPLTGLGTFLRIDIPELAARHHLLDSPYYLYTDCDVIFQNDPSPLLDIETDTFRAAIEINDSPGHFNAGVRWCNAEFFRRSLAEFRQFLIERRFRFTAHDQGAINEFYGGSRQVLPRQYNWKPHWGIEPNAIIVHFHGPKPEAFRLWQRDSVAFMSRWPAHTPFLRTYTREAYQHYVGVF